MNLGIALRAKGDADAAMIEFRSVLESRPNDPDVRQQLGLALKQQGDLNGAIEAFESVLTLNPEHREAYYNLAAVLNSSPHRCGDVLAAAGPSIDAGLRSAKEKLASGDLKGACDLEKLRQDAPASADVLNLLGFVQGQNRDLRRPWRLLSAQWNSVPTCRKRATTWVSRSGIAATVTAALESLKHAVRLNPASAEAYAFLGMALKNQQALQRAIALNPNLPAPYIDLSDGISPCGAG